MSRAMPNCPHRYDDGRTAWGDWRHGARYVGKPQLEPCVARVCELCGHREEYAVIREDDAAPEG